MRSSKDPAKLGEGVFMYCTCKVTIYDRMFNYRSQLKMDSRAHPWKIFSDDGVQRYLREKGIVDDSSIMLVENKRYHRY